MILSNWLDSQVSKVIHVRWLCFVGSLFVRVKMDTSKGFWYPGGKGMAQVCGRDNMGYQSTACLHTGTTAIVSQCFSWKVEGRSPRFCNLDPSSERKWKSGWRRNDKLCNITVQTKGMLKGWDEPWGSSQNIFIFQSAIFSVPGCVWFTLLPWPWPYI